MRRRKLILLAFPVLQALMFGLQLLHPGSLGYAQLTGTVIPLAALGLIVTNITLRRKERERLERRIIPPAKQLKHLSDEYGLPVITPLQKREPLPSLAPIEAERALIRKRFGELKDKPPVVVTPSVSGDTLGHVCNGKYYEFAMFCPVHGDQDVPEKELEPEEVYEPAGQADLLAALLEYVKDQASAAKATQWTASRKREWRVSPEWAAELRKLRTNGASGKLLWLRYSSDKPPREHMLGYPVVVGDQYGVPELTAI